MKKWFLLLMALCLCCSASVSFGADDKYTSGDFEYVLLEDGNVEISAYNGEAEELEIPLELDGKPVTGIRGIKKSKTLRSITVPEGITRLGGEAFFGNQVLETVTLPDSVTDVGTNPFSSCPVLQNIILSPDHPELTMVDGVLFGKSDSRLIWYPMALENTEYEIPEGTLVVGKWAFYQNSLEKIILPDSLTEIGGDAFTYSKQITSLVIPDSVTVIGSAAFSNCPKLVEITLPSGLTTIESFTFERCKGLISLVIPSGVTSIGMYAFSGCKMLNLLTIPESVTQIEGNAFDECPMLTVDATPGSYAETFCKEHGIPLSR